jgi:hypothetical protein
MRPIFPWRVSVNGRELRAMQAGDAMTHPEYRGRGLFSTLVRTAWSDLKDNGVPFGFSFSNPGSLSVCRKMAVGPGPRIGTHVVLTFRRMVFPLSLRLARERFGAPAGLVKHLDVAYRAFRRHRWLPTGSLSAFKVTRFDGEFDELWHRTSREYGVMTVRDSRYLNWRFMDTPSGRFQVLGLRSRGTLVGYVAYEVDAWGSGWIADLFCRPDPALSSRWYGNSDLSHVTTHSPWRCTYFTTARTPRLHSMDDSGWHGSATETSNIRCRFPQPSTTEEEVSCS